MRFDAFLKISVGEFEVEFQVIYHESQLSQMLLDCARKITGIVVFQNEGEVAESVAVRGGNSRHRTERNQKYARDLLYIYIEQMI